MLQSLKKNSRKKIINRLKFRDFIKYRLWQYAFVIAFLLFVGYLFNKIVEAILFAISHTLIRPTLDKQFHFVNNSKSVINYMCMSLTCAIIVFGVYVVLPIALSLVSSVPLAILISYFGYVAQDRLDLQRKLKPNIYMLNDAEFKEYCYRKGLDDTEYKIAVEIIRNGLKGENLYNKICYSKRQTIRIRKRIFLKLNN